MNCEELIKQKLEEVQDEIVDFVEAGYAIESDEMADVITRRAVLKGLLDEIQKQKGE